ncbi:uncharacterized protein ASCRUDRAFT_72348 [Ascoidea rubescens DSM 1968]|uniref:Secreted protein n=1 Tax=Ascoidea rubescens DSM 1968 TaxID=1344418 RepID=A0A1D2VB41_9ASCO|nr:hypothetical protein ASCRUDRAFT_72348 [Ascoidea rubescens DSM 1968]ODV58667.1 hypothetical protein ASCRUDRAFT_72348 [Ascoidea rubescens DSM 1968]
MALLFLLFLLLLLLLLLLPVLSLRPSHGHRLRAIPSFRRSIAPERWVAALSARVASLRACNAGSSNRAQKRVAALEMSLRWLDSPIGKERSTRSTGGTGGTRSTKTHKQPVFRLRREKPAATEHEPL